MRIVFVTCRHSAPRLAYRCVVSGGSRSGFRACIAGVPLSLIASDGSASASQRTKKPAGSWQLDELLRHKNKNMAAVCNLAKSRRICHSVGSCLLVAPYTCCLREISRGHHRISSRTNNNYAGVKRESETGVTSGRISATQLSKTHSSKRYPRADGLRSLTTYISSPFRFSLAGRDGRAVRVDQR
ncbi:hypothetical protein GGS23DRAFT_427600 [Durotheca rogersii]|uniref:uncharacterized protein n=1 Tax=Durotheca rogersii TaxID=419775 RepID=UPI00221E69B7|nr:uncharacterized protein GGS23DRAFT_427600 [Durotheca rogersii]KAI5865458.1 hypothetical protein GGS23DRAFT_427600 [Durotheca rogersii]